MTVGIEDGVTRITDGQIFAVGLTTSVVTGAAIGGEVRRRLDKYPGPRIGTGVGDDPEDTAEVNSSELIWNWLGYFNTSDWTTMSWERIYARTYA